jgi:hypothetical protein
MAKAQINLHVICAEDRVADCAAALQTQLPADQWKLLATLAAEIVARWETVGAGRRVLVVPAENLDRLARAVRASPVPR